MNTRRHALFAAAVLLGFVFAPQGALADLPGARPDPLERSKVSPTSDRPAALVQVDPQGEPLFIETARFDSPPPVSLERGYAQRVAVTPTRSYFLAGDFEVAIVDRVTGEFLGSIVLFDRETSPWDDPFRYPFELFAVHGDDGDHLVVTATTSWPRETRYRVYDVRDAAAPRIVREVFASTIRFVKLPIDNLALEVGDGSYVQITHVPTGDIVGIRAAAGATTIAASAGSSPLTVATLESEPAVKVWDVSDPREFRFLASFPVGSRSGELAVSPSGKAVAFMSRNSSGTPVSIQVFDVAAGVPGAVIPLGPNDSPGIAVADGDDAPVLAIYRRDGLELLDLADIAAPRSIATLDVRRISEIDSPSRVTLATTALAPWLFALDAKSDRLLVIDVNDGSIAASLPTPGYAPEVLATTGSDTIEVSVQGRLRYDGNLSGDRPGAVFQATIDADASIVERPVYGSEKPHQLTTLRTIGGRYLVGYDSYENVLVVVDGATGRMTEALHPAILSNQWQGRRPSLDVQDDRVLVGTSYVDGNASTAGSLLGYRLEEGRLTPLFRWLPPRELVRYFIASVWGPDGSVLMLGDQGLGVRLESGTEVSLPVDKATYYSHLELSPDRERALLQIEWDVSSNPEADFVLLDVANPAAPSLLGRSEGWISTTPRFVDGGRSVLATLSIDEDFGGYQPRLYDGHSAAPLGGLGDRITKFFYHGDGVEFGSGRFAFWEWSWSSWTTSVVDFSVDPPRHLGTSRFWHDDPSYAPRADRDEAYLIAQIDDWWSNDPTNVFIVTSSGDFIPRGEVDAVVVEPLRHGFLAAIGGRGERSLLVLRDPEVNRAPAPSAGPDRTLECLAGEAAIALDGSASVDPDSTPGTSDDIASVRWELDGSFVSGALVDETHAGLGDHEISLTIEDTLGASAVDSARVAVVDTTPPVVSLALAPAIVGGRWPRDAWSIATEADDACDGPIPPAVRLAVAADLFELPVAEGGGTTTEIRVVERAGTRSVEVTGDVALARASWEAARLAGGLPVDVSRALVLERSPTAPSVGGTRLLASYTLDASGRVLRALATGEAADHVLVSRTVDAAGLVGDAAASLRETIRTLCETSPETVVCRPGIEEGTRSPR